MRAALLRDALDNLRLALAALRQARINCVAALGKFVLAITGWFPF